MHGHVGTKTVDFPEKMGSELLNHSALML